MAPNMLFSAVFDTDFWSKIANKRGKVREFRILVYFNEPRISETADKKTANSEGHLYMNYPHFCFSPFESN